MDYTNSDTNSNTNSDTNSDTLNLSDRVKELLAYCVTISPIPQIYIEFSDYIP